MEVGEPTGRCMCETLAVTRKLHASIPALPGSALSKRISVLDRLRHSRNGINPTLLVSLNCSLVGILSLRWERIGRSSLGKSRMLSRHADLEFSDESHFQ